MIKKLNPTVLLDCVGGKLASEVIMRMPPKSTMVMYGNLSNEKIEIDPRPFYRNEKSIESVFLIGWILDLKEEDR